MRVDLLEKLDFMGVDEVLKLIIMEPEMELMWRRFSVWCASHVKHLMVDDRSVAALSAATSYINNEVSHEEMLSTWESACEAANKQHGMATMAEAHNWANIAAACCVMPQPEAPEEFYYTASSCARGALSNWAADGSGDQRERAAIYIGFYDEFLSNQNEALKELLETGGLPERKLIVFDYLSYPRKVRSISD